jgi:hypothetical protein
VLFLCARPPVRYCDCRQIIRVAQLTNHILVGHRFNIRHGPHVSRPYLNLPARRLTVVFLEFHRRPTLQLSSSVVLVVVCLKLLNSDFTYSPPSRQLSIGIGAQHFN